MDQDENNQNLDLIETETPSEGEQAAISINDLDNAIKTRVSHIEQLRTEMKQHKEMIDSYLLNDPKYVEHTELAKKAAALKNTTKRALLNHPSAAQMVEKLNTAKEDLREAQEGLSYYLREYQRLTGADEFEGEDGDVRQIIYVAKLVKRSVFKK